METGDIINVEDLIEVGYRFSELGAAIAEVSASNTQLFDDALENLSTLQELADSLATDTFDKIKSEMGINLAYAPELINTYKNSIASTDKVFESLNSSVTQFRDSLGKPTDRPTDFSSKPFGLADPAKEGKEAEAKQKKSVLRREFDSASSMLKTFASTMKLPLIGGVAAGLGIWAAMGFKRKQRIAAEAGEVKNILVAATDATIKGVLGKATSYLSGLQERLQKEYGIARGDFQGVVKTFVDGGVEIERVLEKVGDRLGEVGEDTLLLTFAVDKMLELPGGTTAKRAVQMMTDYGYSFEKATNSVVDLSLAAQESGIGAAQFLKNITSAGDELKQFGFGINAVADLALTLQERFEAIGVPKQFAGRQAALGIQQMAAGIGNMSKDWQMFVAEKMGYGGGLEGRQKLLSSMDRVGREGSETELMELYQKLGAIAMEIAKGDEVLAKHILEGPMGLGFEGAIAAVEIMKAINTDDVVSAKKIAQERQKELRSALMTEKGKRSQWELQMNNWMDAVAMIGEGLLANASKLLAYLIVIGKAGLSLAANHFAGRDADNQQILNNVSAFMKEHPLSSAKIQEGWSKAVNTFEAMGMNVAGDAAKAVTSAWNMDVADPNWKAGADAGSSAPSSPFASAGGASAPIVQTITVPASTPGTYAMGRPASKKRMMAAGIGSGLFSGGGALKQGGGLSIVSSGVDSVGNIKLSLRGNCPQCGLQFGGAPSKGVETGMRKSSASGEYTSQDVEAMSRMLASEVGRGRLGKGKESVAREAEAIGWTALNRMRRGRKKGKSLSDVLTGGHGFGKQGSKRAYSTKREATPESREIASRLLSGEVQDPTQGATSFFHETGGRPYAGGRAIPRFAEGEGTVNPLNINRARFYRRKGGGVEDAPDREVRDAKLKRQFEARKTKEAWFPSTTPVVKAEG